MNVESFFLWIGFASSAFITSGYNRDGIDAVSIFRQLFLRFLLAAVGIFLSKLIFHLLNPGIEISWNGGFIYIGFLSSFIMYYLLEIYCGKVAKISDSLVIPLLLSYSIGRIGCYFAGCCFGEIFFFPIQLFESFLALILCGFVTSKPSLSKFKIYLFSYFLFRFFTEFFRSDIERGVYNGVSTTQWIILMYLCLFILLKKFFERKIPGHKVPT